MSYSTHQAACVALPPMEHKPKVAVVVLSYNGRELLGQFLPALQAYNPSYSELWVVDNASTDGTEEFVREQFPAINCLRLQVNRGFTNGYVESLPQIAAEYYVLINSDVEVTKDWLQPLVALVEGDATIAAVQPKIRSWRNKQLFEYSGAAGGYLDALGYPFCRGRIFTELEADTGQYQNVQEVFWTSGACMLVRAQLYHQHGGLDNDFYAHMEEIDLCWRLRNLGYRMQVCPQSTVYHVGGHIIQYNSPEKLYLNFRNNLVMLTKNLPAGWGWVILMRLVLDGVAALASALGGNTSLIKAVWRAHGYYRRHLGDILHKRRLLVNPTLNRRQGLHKPGYYAGSIVWDFFVQKKKTFAALKQ